jgi:hypothetical protein
MAFGCVALNCLYDCCVGWFRSSSAATTPSSTAAAAAETRANALALAQRVLDDEELSAWIYASRSVHDLWGEEEDHTIGVVACELAERLQRAAQDPNSDANAITELYTQLVVVAHRAQTAIAEHRRTRTATVGDEDGNAHIQEELVALISRAESLLEASGSAVTTNTRELLYSLPVEASLRLHNKLTGAREIVSTRQWQLEQKLPTAKIALQYAEQTVSGIEHYEALSFNAILSGKSTVAPGATMGEAVAADAQQRYQREKREQAVYCISGISALQATCSLLEEAVEELQALQDPNRADEWLGEDCDEA